MWFSKKWRFRVKKNRSIVKAPDLEIPKRAVFEENSDFTQKATLWLVVIGPFLLKRSRDVTKMTSFWPKKKGQKRGHFRAFRAISPSNQAWFGHFDRFWPFLTPQCDTFIHSWSMASPAGSGHPGCSHYSQDGQIRPSTWPRWLVQRVAQWVSGHGICLVFKGFG